MTRTYIPYFLEVDPNPAVYVKVDYLMVKYCRQVPEDGRVSVQHLIENVVIFIITRLGMVCLHITTTSHHHSYYHYHHYSCRHHHYHQATNVECVLGNSIPRHPWIFP